MKTVFAFVLFVTFALNTLAECGTHLTHGVRDISGENQVDRVLCRENYAVGYNDYYSPAVGCVPPDQRQRDAG